MSQFVTDKDGNCFHCGGKISSIKAVPAQYDNGEPTVIVIAICKDCEAKK